MASRKEQKEAARAERLRQEAAEATAAQRARRLKVAGAMVAAALLAVLAVAVVQLSNRPGDIDRKAAEEVAAQLRGIEQNGNVFGDPDAPVTIREYGDLQCPACKEFANTVLPTVLDEFVATGQAKFEFNNWAILGPDSETAARAALAAGEEDKMLHFVELFYRNQGVEHSGYVTDEYLETRAREAGLDLEQFNADRKRDWSKELAAIADRAREEGFDSTPSLLVVGPEGEAEVANWPDPESFREAIELVS